MRKKDEMNKLTFPTPTAAVRYYGLLILDCANRGNFQPEIIRGMKLQVQSIGDDANYAETWYSTVRPVLAFLDAISDSADSSMMTNFRWELFEKDSHKLDNQELILTWKSSWTSGRFIEIVVYGGEAIMYFDCGNEEQNSSLLGVKNGQWQGGKL